MDSGFNSKIKKENAFFDILRNYRVNRFFVQIYFFKNRMIKSDFFSQNMTLGASKNLEL